MEDLRNFCSKVDVDTIRAKIPPMPQIKLPKSVSKLKSRKIFHISREDFSSISRRTYLKRTATVKSENNTIALEAPYPIPPAEFIDRTPTRISTISSLKNQENSGSGDVSVIGKHSKMWKHQNNLNDDNENSYRNAGGIDDYYPSPLTRLEQRLSRNVSPIKESGGRNVLRAHSEQNVKMSIGEKLQKLSEFKIKHLFAKRTVVHADKIEVDSYIPSFDEDRKREEIIKQKIDRDIADNYRFQFKAYQQKESEESYVDFDSPFSSPEHFGTINKQKHLSELSGDESGMESSPPKRKPGIASTRFSRVRQNPLNMSLEESYHNENIQPNMQQNTRKSLNPSQEEVNNVDDDGMEIELVKSPQKKPNHSSRQSPRKKSAKGTAATASSMNRNAAANRTQDELLDDDVGDIEINEEVESTKDLSSRQNPRRKSARVRAAKESSRNNNTTANKSQEDIPDENEDIEFYEVEELEPKKQKRNTESLQDTKNKKSTSIYKRSRENFRKSIKGMTSSAAFTKERQSAINRTQEDELDLSSDGGIEMDKGRQSQPSENNRILHQKSLKGVASTNAFTKDRQGPLNKTQEDDIDLSSDGGMELYENEKHKSFENIRILRQKSVKGIAATNAFSKERQGPLNKTQEDELDISSDGAMELNTHQNTESHENNGYSYQKSNKGIVSQNAFSKDRQGPLKNTQEDELDLSSDGGIELYDNIKSKSPENIISRQKSVKGVASTNAFSKERQGPLNRTLDDELDLTSDDIDEDIELDVDEEMESPKLKPNSSTLYDIKDQKLNTNPQKSRSIKERMSRFTKQKLDDNEFDKGASGKRRRPSQTSDQYLDNDGTRKSDKPLDTIKQNFKRIHKSIKMPQHMKINSGSISENDDTVSENNKKLSKTQKLSESIKRFRSSDNIDKTSEDGERIKSPMHNNFTTKIKPVGTLIKKLKHIKSRRRVSNDDPDDDEEGGDTYKESFAARAKLQFEKGAVAASQVPQMTMKKISETKKLFKKKQEENENKKKTTMNTNTDEEELDEGKIKTSPKQVEPHLPTRPPPPIPRPLFNNTSSEEDDADNQKFITKSIAESQLIAVPAARTIWATKPILSDDVTDYEEDLPRVVLHQDNSNVFEPTLIIAVTRPISCTTSPIITEIPLDSTGESTPDTKPDNWIPHQDKVATLLEMTPPSQRRISVDKTTHNHARNQSIDYSSDDSWIKDIPKGPSTAVPIIQQEQEGAWNIQKSKTEEQIHKTESIDIFNMQKQQAFEDFDDELKNTPVIKIGNEIPTVYETETDDNEEFKDFDEYEIASPVKIEVKTTIPVELDNKSSSADEIEAEVFKDLDDEVTEASVDVKQNDIKITSDDATIIGNKNYLTSEEQINSKVNLNKNEENLLKEIHRNIDDYQRESSEEVECTDDDNSSRVTKISVQCLQTLRSETTKINADLKPQAYGKTRESLTAKKSIDSGEEDDVESDDDNKYINSGELVNTPPSKAPSPPPALSTTQPPLPQRKLPINLPSFELDCPTLPPPPLPLTKPPVPPKRPTPEPPKIPQRYPVNKPLVKTSSLRLAYNEQVHPNDVGKVNKLITRFEAEAPKQRPIIVTRKPYLSEESEESSDYEDLVELLPKTRTEKINSNKRPILQKSISIDSDETTDKKSTSIKNITDNNKPKSTYITEIQKKSTSSIANIDIPNQKEKKSSVLDNSELQQKFISKDLISNISNNNIPEIQERTNSLLCKINNSDQEEKKPLVFDNSEIQQISKDLLKDIPQIQKISNAEIRQQFISEDSLANITKNNESKPTLNNNLQIQEKQQKFSSQDSLTDIPNNNDNKTTSNDVLQIPEKQQKFISPDSLTDIPNNNDNKTTSNDVLQIQEIEQKLTSKDSLNDVPNDNDNKTTSNDVLQIQENFKSITLDPKSSTAPLNNSDIQKKLNSKDSIDKNNTSISTDVSKPSTEPYNNSEIQKELISEVSIAISSKNNTSITTDVPNSNNNTTTNNVTEVQMKLISQNSQDKTTILKKSSTIDSDKISDINDKEPTSIDINNSIDDTTKSLDITECEEKSNSLGCNIDIKDQNDMKSSVNDNFEIQQNCISENSPADIANNNENKPTPNDIITIEEKNQKDSITDIPNNMDNKSTLNNDILLIQEKINSLDLDSKESDIQKELISKDSMDISDKNNTPISRDIPKNNNNTTTSYVSEVQRKLISKNSQEYPISNDIPMNKHTTTSDIQEKHNSTDSITNSDKKSALIHIQDQNENKPPIANDNANIPEKCILTDSIDMSNKKLNAIDISDNKQLTSVNITNIDDNQNKLVIAPDNNDNISTTTTIVPDNNDNISTPICKINTPQLLDNNNYEIINTNKISSEAISIYPNCTDMNLNISQPASRYGSPEAFSLNLVGSTEVTPLVNRKDTEYLKHSNDNLMSIDSDEENSYYSLSSTSSYRNVVDL